MKGDDHRPVAGVIEDDSMSRKRYGDTGLSGGLEERCRSDEEMAVGGGSYVDKGNVPHESLNFLPVGDTCYV